jgi:hypothetical protein
VKKRVTPLALVVLLSTAQASSLLAQGRTFIYDGIHVEMSIQKDTSIDVVERQEVLLTGYWKGLYREYGLGGCDSITILGVSENGKPYTRGDISTRGSYQLEKGEGRAIRVRWFTSDEGDPPYRDHKTSFEIRYRITGAIGQYRSRDVLYWKPIISDRMYYVRHASVRVILPQASNNLEVRFYTQAPNARWEFDKEDPRKICFSADNLLRSDTFEIKIDLPKGILSAYHSPTNWYYYNAKALVMPAGLVLGITVLAIVWSFIGKDPLPDPLMEKQFNIATIPPGLSGALLYERFDERDLAATLLDLARRGYIRVEEASSAAGEYTFTLLKSVLPGNVAQFEYRLLTGLFEDKIEEGARISTSRLKDRSPSGMSAIRRAAWEEIYQRQWFSITPRQAMITFGLIALAIIAPATILLAFESYDIAFSAIWVAGFIGIPGAMLVATVKREGIRGLRKGFFFVPFMAIGLGVLGWQSLAFHRAASWKGDLGILGVILSMATCAVGPLMARKSVLGATIASKVREFSNVLKNTPQLESTGLEFSDVLPWAVALGIVKQTLGNYSDAAYFTTPYLYLRQRLDRSCTGATPSSASAASLLSLSDSLSAMVASIGSAFASAPVRSGSEGPSSDDGGAR